MWITGFPISSAISIKSSKEFIRTDYSLSLDGLCQCTVVERGSTVKIIFELVTPDNDAAIWVIPGATLVINPAEDIVATPVLELLHVT